MAELFKPTTSFPREEITLYHASNLKVECPDLNHSKRAMDFGRGFYLTPNMAMARKYRKSSCLNVYTFKSEENLKIKHFNKYDDEWLDFILANRNNLNVDSYDIVVGFIADDTVFEAIRSYTHNLITRKRLFELLEFKPAYTQYCFLTEESLHCLEYRGDANVHK